MRTSEEWWNFYRSITHGAAVNAQKMVYIGLVASVFIGDKISIISFIVAALFSLIQSLQGALKLRLMILREEKKYDPGKRFGFRSGSFNFNMVLYLLKISMAIIAWIIFAWRMT